MSTSFEELRDDADEAARDTTEAAAIEEVTVEQTAVEEATAEDVGAFFARVRALVDARLDAIVPADGEDDAGVREATRWSLFAGGKRFRPALVFAVGETFGARAESLIETACAFEMVHTYSLVHDDLPAMDDDDLRRGRPTCHVRFGEAVAILTGDALQARAFQVIAEDDALDATVRARLVSELARAAGSPAGMVAGQARDLAAETRDDVTAEELDSIHRLKTGALIASAARAGALVAGARASELAALTRYAHDLGLLFQITDDLLDVTSTAETLGKTPGKDARSQKATYPALHGLEGARRRAASVYEDACAALDELERPASLLRGIARFILERKN
ncbi:MAG TPA: farnesyl diphosphate synthase [Pyrinomonadaceae bacterium]|nr:farnesyl diphosphate synthase [Pyrinomonadaceae bacterium]